jgi:hypothetical protein
MAGNVGDLDKAERMRQNTVRKEKTWFFSKNVDRINEIKIFGFVFSLVIKLKD